jgi:hypothetical protein
MQPSMLNRHATLERNLHFHIVMCKLSAPCYSRRGGCRRRLNSDVTDETESGRQRCQSRGVHCRDLRDGAMLASWISSYGAAVISQASQFGLSQDNSASGGIVGVNFFAVLYAAGSLVC